MIERTMKERIFGINGTRHPLPSPRLPSTSSFLVLGSASLSLVSQLLGTKGLGLLFVDKFHQDALVLEHVTLHDEKRIVGKVEKHEV